jgi:hypothetical protein
MWGYAYCRLKETALEYKVKWTLKNDVFWDVMPCGSCNRSFRGTYYAFLRSVLRLLVTANVVPSSPIFTSDDGVDTFLRNVDVYNSNTASHIQEGILRSRRRENLKSYTALTGWALQRRRNASPVRYELGFYIPEDDSLHSHRRENLKSYMKWTYPKIPPPPVAVFCSLVIERLPEVAGHLTRVAYRVQTATAKQFLHSRHGHQQQQ